MLYLSKRPKINVHEHIQKGFNFRNYLAVMDAYNIEKVFFLATGSKGNEGYEPHQEYLAKIKAEFPDRVEMFVSVAHSRENCLEQFEAGLKHNPIGLKLMNGHPGCGEVLPMDHPRLLPLFERCQKENLMVLAHWQLNLKPDNWTPLKKILRDFPQMTFLLAHLGVGHKELSKLAALLNTYDNLYMDCSWGGYFQHFVKEVDWEPEKYRDFYTQYADRISWGTDQIMTTHTTQFLLWQHAPEIAILERKTYRGWQKYFPDREVFGLGLDEETLNKIFYKTPKAILKRIGK